ncbi:MAG: late competence development ComFB family protein [Oscillospiraceae bacterium]|nr:late competence development ComFB family protein [Oscillospiraceae bacterium]
MEKIVQQKLEAYLPDSGCCACDMCAGDIMCLALNKLPPKYVNTHKGELFSRVDQIMLRQNSVDIDFAVINAIEQIKDNPRCQQQAKK